MVGHATHFLERLKRADNGQAASAMRLYHHPHEVRAFLAMMSLPKSVERVALSISPADKGPFVVVSSTGAFVTCLGEGMKTGDLFVVSHERLQSYLDRLATLKSRAAYFGETFEDLRPDETVENALARKGHLIAREDILAISALQPVLKYDALIDLDKYARRLRDFERVLLRLKKIPPDLEKGMLTWWNCQFAVGHLLMLATMFGPQGLEPFLSSEYDNFHLHEPFRLGQLSFAARSILATAKLGRFALPTCQNYLTKPVNPMEWLFGVMGLLAIGCRHQKLKSKAFRLIQKAFKENKTNASILVHNYQTKLGPEFIGAVKFAMNDEAGLHDMALRANRHVYFTRCQKTPFSPPYQFETMEDIPESLAFAYGINILSDIRIDPQISTHLVKCIPWLARAEAEDLYLPRDLLKQASFEWNPAFSEYMFNNFRAWYVNERPRTSVSRPGRNDPCHCGSGKKYKKCCRTKDDAQTALFVDE